MSGVSSKDWLRFFGAAGIPRAECARYAVTFLENRITMDMLTDLNKEYLRDMGITVLGDIIRILKQAKAVGGRLCAEKFDPEPTPTPTPPAPKLPPATPPVPVELSVPPAPKLSRPSREKKHEQQQLHQPSPKQRLGPPAEIKFSDVQSRRAPTAASSSSSSSRDYGGRDEGRRGSSNNVFGRLEKKREEHHSPSRDFQPRGTKPTDLPIHKRQISSSGVVGPSNSPPSRLSNSGRGDGSSSSKPASAFNRLGDHAQSSPTSPDRKKTYVLVRTLRDGTQTKQRIDPDDPILKRVPITKAGSSSRDEGSDRHTRHLYKRDSHSPPRQDKYSRYSPQRRSPSPPLPRYGLNPSRRSAAAPSSSLSVRSRLGGGGGGSPSTFSSGGGDGNASRGPRKRKPIMAPTEEEERRYEEGKRQKLAKDAFAAAGRSLGRFEAPAVSERTDSSSRGRRRDGSSKPRVHDRLGGGSPVKTSSRSEPGRGGGSGSVFDRIRYGR